LEKGLVVNLRKSKTDRDRKGRFIEVWRGSRPITDPVATLRAWLDRRGSWDGPLFCRIQTGDKIKPIPVTGLSINLTVKRAIRRAGIDPARYGAHSLRAGAVTASAEIGRSDQEIMRMSGHRDPKVMQMYVSASGSLRGPTRSKACCN
jgi:integrase